MPDSERAVGNCTHTATSCRCYLRRDLAVAIVQLAGNFWNLLMLLHHFRVLGLTLPPSDAYLSLCELVFGNLWNLLMPLNHFRVLGLALPPSDARLLLLASATIQAVVLTKTPTSNIQEVFHVTSRRPTSRIRRRRIATIGTLDQVC